MLSRCTHLAALLAAAFILAPLHAAPKENVSPFPGNPPWEIRAFNIYFNVLSSDYDADKKQLKWSLELKDDYRTLDFQRDLDKDRPFTLLFLDADDQELGRIRLDAAKFTGIPQERIIKRGTRLDATVDVPDVLGKTKKIVLKRGKID